MEIVSKAEFYESMAGLNRQIRELKEIITGTLAKDKYIPLKDAMILSGYGSKAGFYAFVEREEIRTTQTGTRRKYNQFDIIKHSKSTI